MDLWPDEIEAIDEIKSPVTILKEQASLLGNKTKNVLKAEVRPTNRVGEEFSYRFFLVAPALQDYHYELFTIWHTITLYPVKFLVDSEIAEEFKIGKDRTLNAHSEEKFIEILERILKSKKTVEVMQVLLAQSTDYDPKTKTASAW